MISDKELYEQAKRVIRGTLESIDFPFEDDPFKRNFILACQTCGLAFANDISVGVMGAHFEQFHNVNIEAGEQPVLDLIWIGEGPPPESQS